jgi:trk system potassium uptake protein TrkH
MYKPPPGRFKQLIQTFSPAQFLLTGFLLIALTGAFLLSLPISNANGEWQPFLDALFVSSSAVSTTGLSVVDIGSYYSGLGQIIILLLIQIGGLGYMTFFAFIILAFEQRLSFKSGEAIQQSLSAPSRGGTTHHLKQVVLFTFIFEGVGTIALALYWLPHYSLGEAFYLGLFHSVSAFCTAGFGLFADNFIAYEDDVYINMVLNILCIAGGIGFLVLTDVKGLVRHILDHHHPRHLPVHTKLALMVFTILTLMGTALILIAEDDLTGRPFGSRLLSASFQALTASSTTGFNSVNISQMSDTSLFVLILLMFIGAPAGGTGGGIKSTTFGVNLLFVWALLKGQREVNVFERRIPQAIISQTVGIGVMAAGWVILMTILLTFTEESGFLAILFEVVSALGTVGLSVGITADLSAIGKLAIIMTMLIGRVGLLSIGYSLMQKRQETPYHYPEEEIFVG